VTPVSAMPIAATQFATVPPARLSLREAAVSNVPALVSRSWSALTAAASWTAVLARPTSRVAATGVGYAGPAGAETRRGTDGRDVPSGTAAGKRFIGTNGNGKQQDQLHLMSRRDPRSWRPPA
jgi:hypothetical protein